MTPTAEAILEKIKIPTLSEVTQQVLTLVNSKDASARTYANLVLKDPGLSTTVMKLVNSALYSLPNRIVSIPDACVMLGLRNLSALCLNAALAQEMSRSTTHFAARCWRHCLATGYVATGLSTVLCPDQTSDVHTAGLLHGVGLLGLLGTLDLDLEAMVETAESQQIDLLEVEEEALGFHHAHISRGILERWRMHPRVCELVVECEDLPQIKTRAPVCIALASLLVQTHSPEFRTRANPGAEFSQLMDRFPIEAEAIESSLQVLLDEAEMQIQLLRS